MIRTFHASIFQAISHSTIYKYKSKGPRVASAAEIVPGRRACGTCHDTLPRHVRTSIPESLGYNRTEAVSEILGFRVRTARLRGGVRVRSGSSDGRGGERAFALWSRHTNACLMSSPCVPTLAACTQNTNINLNVAIYAPRHLLSHESREMVIQ